MARLASRGTVGMSGEPIVVVTGRGKVHKALRDFRGAVVGHPRCRLSAPGA